MRLASACLATGLVLMVLAPPAEASRFAAQRPFPQVSVTGEGRMTAAPDMVEATAGVTTEAATSGEAAAANAKIMAQVVQAVRAAGIAEEDIRTARYAVEPVQVYPARRITGYRAANMVRLRIRNVENVAAVLDAVTAAGATDIASVEFTLAEPAAVADKAREAAFADAKRKASVYAQAAGAQLGRALGIGEPEMHSPRPMAMRATAADSAATPVVPGEVEVQVRVQVTFELLQ